MRALLFLSILAMGSGSLSAVRARELVLTGPEYGIPRASIASPAVASNGSSFLAAWIETSQSRAPEIAVQRLDHASDPTAVAVPIVTGSDLAHASLDLVWTGTSYLLVWSAEGVLHSLRLDEEGRPRVGSARQLGYGYLAPMVATNGSETLILAYDASGTNTVLLSLGAGDEITHQSVLLTTGAFNRDIAATSGGFVVTLCDYTGLYFIRIGRDGMQLDAAPQPLMLARGTTGPDYRPATASVASHGSSTLVLWSAHAGDDPADLFFSLIPLTGPASIPRSVPHSVSAIQSVDLASDPIGFTALLTSGPMSFIDYQKDSRIESVSLDMAGSPRATATVVDDPISYESQGRIAANAFGYGVIWAGSQYGVGIRLLGFTSPVLGGASPVVLSRAVREQVQPAIASDGIGFLTAWLEQSQDSQKIKALLLDRFGVPAGSVQTLMDRPYSYATAPRVIYGHGVYLVAWTVDSALWGMRITLSGTLIDTIPFRISDPQLQYSDFDFTVTGQGFFVVWSKEGRIRGAHISPQGVGSSFPLTEDAPDGFLGDQTAPRIAFNQGSFVLVYDSTKYDPCYFPGSCSSETRRFVVRLDTEGRRLPPGTLRLSGPEVRAIRAGANGFALLHFRSISLLDPETLQIKKEVPLGLSSSTLIAAFWNGAAYRVIWSEPLASSRRAVYAREIDANGAFGPATKSAVIDSPAFVTDAAENLIGDILIVYSARPAEAPFYGTPMVADQVLSDGLLPPQPRPRGARR